MVHDGPESKRSTDDSKGELMYRSDSNLNLDQKEIHDVLRNERRQNVLKQLKQNMGRLTVRTLAEALAEAETGESPPPRNIRRSVYNSLHQTHLPKMDDLDVVDYDRDRKVVSMRSNIRQVDVYMEAVTPYEVTWAEYYQFLMFLALLVVAIAELGAPLLSSVPSLVLCFVFMAILGLSTVYQLWSRRWLYLQQLFS